MSRSVALLAAMLVSSQTFAQQSGALTAPPVERVLLTAGRSVVLMTDFEIRRIAVTNPAIADATVVAPQEMLIDGKAPGTVSLIVWGDDRRNQYDLVVDPGVSPLQQQLQTLFPGEDIQVGVTDDATILSGHASSNNVMLRAGEVAEASASKRKLINLLQLPGGSESQQVMLQVRVAEVSRRAVSELGVSLFTGPTGIKDTVGRETTGQFPAPTYTGLTTSRVGGTLQTSSGEITFSDFLNLFVFSNKYNLGALIRALKSKGNFQSLAEPNLVAYNGQEASFLAGGEFPVPIVQGVSGSATVVFKEFGVRLSFKPTIAGDVIRLHVRPEVSALDFANGVSLGGYRIPALTTRRAETDVELRDGQSFAIAGLLDNVAQSDSSNVPGMSSLPIIGVFFKARALRAERTELMILITPHLIRPLDPDEVPALPVMSDMFLAPESGVGSELEGGGGLVDAPAVPGKDEKTGAGAKRP